MHRANGALHAHSRSPSLCPSRRPSGLHLVFIFASHYTCISSVSGLSRVLVCFVLASLTGLWIIQIAHSCFTVTQQSVSRARRRLVRSFTQSRASLLLHSVCIGNATRCIGQGKAEHGLSSIIEQSKGEQNPKVTRSTSFKLKIIVGLKLKCPLYQRGARTVSAW